MLKRTCFCLIIASIAVFSLGSNCEHGLKPRFTAVEGNVIVKGDWPEEAVNCFLCIVEEKPEELVLDMQLLSGYYPFPNKMVTEGWDSAYFYIELPAGNYGWVFVAILDSASLDLENPDIGWRNLAAEYRDPLDPDTLGKVIVGEDELPFIEIEIDFTVPYQGVGNSPDERFHLIG
ncbi:hypothetical protein DRQ36_00415 [bacterium]|nr:MAG: hypothetical protein DRQ36_00415 [bacterium]